jgi:hypothetical protein
MQPPPDGREQPSTLNKNQTCSQLAPVSDAPACQPAADED